MGRQDPHSIFCRSTSTGCISRPREVLVNEVSLFQTGQPATVTRATYLFPSTSHTAQHAMIMIVRPFKRTRLAITLALAAAMTSVPNTCVGFHIAPVSRAVALRRPSSLSSLEVVSSTVVSTSVIFRRCSVLGGRQTPLAPASHPRSFTQNPSCPGRNYLEMVVKAPRQLISAGTWSSKGVARAVSCAAGEGEITVQQREVGATAEFGLDDNALGVRAMCWRTAPLNGCRTPLPKLLGSTFFIQLIVQRDYRETMVCSVFCSAA